MRTKDQLKQVVERALYEPNSKAFLKREMQFVKEKYYYEHEDFLNDSLMNISEIASSETFRFNIQRNQIKQRLSKEEFINNYYGFCIDKNEGLTFEEYFEREEPKVKQKIKDEITALEKRHKAYINKCNKIDSELKVYILIKKYPTFQSKSIPLTNLNGTTSFITNDKYVYKTGDYN